MKGLITTDNNKIYIKTDYQTLILTPRYREKAYYMMVLRGVQRNRYKSVSELVHRCNNRIDIVQVNYAHIDNNSSNL